MDDVGVSRINGWWRMKILFYLGHPAHYHLFKNIIKQLEKNSHKIFILIKKKDVLEELVKKSGHQYVNILPGGRRDYKLAIALGLLKRDARMFWFSLINRPDIMIGTSAEITHVGKILGIPSINVNEDDFDAVPLFAKLGYPWASSILVPESCDTGKWNYKTVNYRGYHELAYLHPNYFKPKKELIRYAIDLQKPYCLIRFAKLSAHHDEGKTGITPDIALKVIDLLKPHGNVYISSERKLEPEFEKYRIAIDPYDIHHALYYATMFIGDSQTMTAESAVLGIPAIRFNDFVGKLGYLKELETQYGLTYGIKTSEPEHLYQKINELLNMTHVKAEWKRRRQTMLRQKIDVTAFIVWFLEKYPDSQKIMKTNPDYQLNFG
jgi:predicted glycosyltransferase